MDCAEGVGIYARVGFYENWINKMMDDDNNGDDIVENETTTKFIEYTTDYVYQYGEKVKKFFFNVPCTPLKVLLFCFADIFSRSTNKI